MSPVLKAGPVSQARYEALRILVRVEQDKAFADIVRLRMFITDMSRAGELMAVQAERFRDIRPAATLVEVSALRDPSLLVEIEAVAQR